MLKALYSLYLGLGKIPWARVREEAKENLCGNGSLEKAGPAHLFTSQN